jgi:itaconate CoA-transferase
VLAERVLGEPGMATDPAFATAIARVKNRAQTDGRVAKSFASMNADVLEEKLVKAEIAFAHVNDVAGLARHPHYRRIEVGTPTGPVSYSAPAVQWAGKPRDYGPVPALGANTDAVRAEFLGKQAKAS